MDVEAKIIGKDKAILDQLDDSYLEYKPFLLYFEDASFKIVDKASPQKSCTIFYKEIEPEIIKKQKASEVLIFKIINLENGHIDKKLVLEIKPNEKNQKKIYHLFQSKKRLTTFKTPLSYSPARLARPSLLSSESPTQNYRGFINLAIIVLVVTNFRLVIENFLKYGWLIRWVSPTDFLTNPRSFPCLSATFGLGIFLFAAFKIEKLALSHKITEKRATCLNILNISLCLISPGLLIYLVHPLPIPALVLLMIGLIVFFKLISYAHVFYNVREILQKMNTLQKENRDFSLHIRDSDLDSANREQIAKNMNTPEKLVDLKQLFYFVAAPTLCFQLVYPRTNEIRKIWLFKRVVELIIVLSVMSFIIQQYIVPIVESSIPHMKDKNYSYLFERLLKLSLPNVYVWIAIFLSLFHLFFNITAELLMFADRQFYLDWWNCRNLSEYWKLWNLPMRNFFIRHIYNPMLRRGYSKTSALFFVFFVSAIGHEYLVSVSLGVLSFWAFFAMLAQVPSILFQNFFEKYISKSNNVGNVMFWLSFCFIGQPMCVFIYYDLYLRKYIDNTL